MSNPYKGNVKRMQADKRAYGALDGDWAKRCIKCGARFTGTGCKCLNCLSNRGK